MTVNAKHGILNPKQIQNPHVLNGEQGFISDFDIRISNFINHDRLHKEMKMDKKLVKAFNDQIKNELASGYLYLSMAAYFEAKNLSGFARWVKAQAKEEVGHAMKLFGHLTERGARVELQAIPQPEIKFSSAVQVFEKTLAHEKKVTGLINKLYELSQKVNDYPASILLQWFITEQVEEEATADSILQNLKKIKPDSAAMLMYDQVMGKRE